MMQVSLVDLVIQKIQSSLQILYPPAIHDKDRWSYYSNEEAFQEERKVKRRFVLKCLEASGVFLSEWSCSRYT